MSYAKHERRAATAEPTHDARGALAGEVPVRSVLEPLLRSAVAHGGATAEAPSGPTQASMPRIGRCLDAVHPTLSGRVEVAWRDDRDQAQRRWLPTLRGLVVRRDDRLLLSPVADQEQPLLVTGVVDGFEPRPEPEPRRAAQLELKPDECLAVVDGQGNPVLTIAPSADGPVVRLDQPDLSLELPGKLRIRAGELELRADRGAARLTAREDVVVAGEAVRIN